MTDLTFYRAWVLAPFVAPLPGLLLAALGAPPPPEPWLSISLTLSFSLILGCIPYLVLAAVLWWWLPGRRPWLVRLVALAAPLPMVAANAVLPWMQVPFGSVVGVAYGYVALFLLSEQVGRLLGWVRPARPANAAAAGARVVGMVGEQAPHLDDRR